MKVEGNDKQQLFETYHGVYVSVKYEITVDCVRGFMKNNLHKTMEFIVEVPVRWWLLETERSWVCH
jgi:hypothetical protein